MNYKAEILKGYPIKAELHLHTSPVSRCAKITPAEVVEKYHKEGYNLLTITNHIDPCALGFSEDEWVEHYIGDFLEAEKRGEELGVKVVLGAEVRFTENANDYLCYGVDEEAVRLMYRHLDKGIEAFYNAVDHRRTVVLQAHPFRDNMEQNYTDKLDGIEIFNMAGHNARIPSAVKFHLDNKGIATGGMDLHYPQIFPIFATRFKELPEDSMALAELLRGGDYIFTLGDYVII